MVAPTNGTLQQFINVSNSEAKLCWYMSELQKCQIILCMCYFTKVVVQFDITIYGKSFLTLDWHSARVKGEKRQQYMCVFYVYTKAHTLYNCCVSPLFPPENFLITERLKLFIPPFLSKFLPGSQTLTYAWPAKMRSIRFNYWFVLCPKIQYTKPA